MTQSVQNGSFLTISVPAGYTLTVSADADSSGNVYQQSDSTLLGAVEAGGSLEIGPYTNTRIFILVPTVGALTYGDMVLSVPEASGEVVTVGEGGTVHINPPDGQVQIQGNGLSGGVLIGAGPEVDNSMQLSVDNANADVTASGDGAQLRLQSQLGYVYVYGDSGITLSSPGPVSLSASTVTMPTLPTANPGIAGALWNSAGTLKISAG